MRGLARTLLLAALALLVMACGTDEKPPLEDPGPPPWARVAPEQIAAAKRQGVPVAFENDLGMRFVLIPGGTFQMGSPEDEAGRDDDETRHEVTISGPFYLQTSEATNGQFRRFEPAHDSGKSSGVSLNGDDQPVVDVTWEDAVAFAKWATQADRKRSYRLPTEAEWERACRAGGTTPYLAGNRPEDLLGFANFADRSLLGEDAPPSLPDDGHRGSAPVASFSPNAWGLYDMAGNVSEWCLDWYGRYPSKPLADPHGPRRPGLRRYKDHIIRGGSWHDPLTRLRSASRSSQRTRAHYALIGFRLASSLSD